VRGNKFEEFVNRVYDVRETQYIVMLIRPNSSEVSRRVRRAVTDRGIDLGMELFETGKEVIFKDGMVAEKRGR